MRGPAAPAVRLQVALAGPGWLDMRSSNLPGSSREGLPPRRDKGGKTALPEEDRVISKGEALP